VLVRGARGKRLASVLQPGNGVIATWRARLEDHLGTYSIEPVHLRAATVIEQPIALFALSTMTALLAALPEREPHRRLYDGAQVLLDNPEAPAIMGLLMVRFELALLGELGFGLELSRCAATGGTAELCYVSPKSGRAVSRDAGLPYHNRLLALPPVLRAEPDENAAALWPGPADFDAGFRLTGHFLDRHVFGPRGFVLPECRQSLITALINLG